MRRLSIAWITFLILSSCVVSKPPAPPFSVTPSTDVLGLTKKEVAQSLRPQLKAVQDCYEKALASYRSLEGRLFLEIKISSTGGVQESTIIRDEMSMKAPEFDKCLNFAVSAIKFPAPRGGVSVSVQYYPLIFKPKN